MRFEETAIQQKLKAIQNDLLKSNDHKETQIQITHQHDINLVLWPGGLIIFKNLNKVKKSCSEVVVGDNGTNFPQV